MTNKSQTLISPDRCLSEIRKVPRRNQERNHSHFTEWWNSLKQVPRAEAGLFPRKCPFHGAIPGAQEHLPCCRPSQPPGSPAVLSAPISSPLVSPLPRGGSGMDPAQKARRSSSSSASCAHGGQQRDPCTTGIPERGTGVIPAEGEWLRDLPNSSF